jgi:glycerol-3-phosphate acyltransferase PlsX
MGGDLGPKVQVEGAIKAFKNFGITSLLVGPKQDISDIQNSLTSSESFLEIVDADQVIDMHDSPARAVRKKPNSSLCVAYNLVTNHRASAVLSSGNSGAMMAAGRMISGLLNGIERPAIATLIPTVGSGHPNVVIDSGANVDCHAHNLVQFAVMGSIYHTALFNSESPKVALLSNGSETSKGTDTIRSASLILSQMNGINYVGYAEGRDVTREIVNVIVCDGFVGNILLKSMEGCVTLIYKQIKHEMIGRPISKFGLFLAKGLLKAVFKDKFDYTSIGGAPLLGLRDLAIVLHGSSNERAVESAIKLSNSFSKSQMIEKLTAAMSRLEEHLVELEGEVVPGIFSSGTGPMNGKIIANNQKSAYDEAAEDS